MPYARRPLFTAAAVLTLLAGSVHGQSTPPAPPASQPTPARDPALTSPSVRQSEQELRNRALEPASVAPVTRPSSQPAAPVGPAATAAFRDIAPQTGARLVPEGSFLVTRRGSLVSTGEGDWLFVFHPGADNAVERPMVLVPCMTLQRMQTALAGRGQDAVFRVTGQVLVYQGLNYLLPTAFSVTSAADEARTATPANAGQGAVVPPDRDSPAVKDLIAELKARRERPRGIARSTPAAPAATMPGASDDPAVNAAPVPEGTMIVRRRARLARGESGGWILHFDNATASAIDPPMTIAPSQKLAQMEQLASRHGDAISLAVSGRVYSYGGQNVILPTMFQVVGNAGIEPRH